MVEGRTGASITLWDSSAEPPEHAGRTYLWDGYAESESNHSILRYVELHGDRLRSKYLAWIHDLGESRIDGKRLVDHLALDNEFSYWWMTPFVEKSPWKTPSIIDAIRLLALEEIIAQQRPRKLSLVSANRGLHLTLRKMCQDLGIAYDWKRVSSRSIRRLNLRDIYQALPLPIQGALYLVHYLRIRWPMRRAEKSGWCGGGQSLFICSYFFHIDTELAREGKFHSRYWEGLHELIGRLGLTVNWLQIYYAHAAVPNPEVALNWVNRFNHQRQTQGFHSFTDAYLSLRAVPRVLKGLFKLIVCSLRVRQVERAFIPTGSRLSFWPLMRRDWATTMRGPVAVGNLLWIELFNEAMRDMPRQERGLYLCENQAWERAMIYAWRKHGHGELTAIAHSTVRFWDLRYFMDRRTVHAHDTYLVPRPDRIALNGKVAVDTYLCANSPRDVIVECEALRYGYLEGVQASPSSRGKKGAIKKVLILGDYMRFATVKMLEMMEAAAQKISVPSTYTIKPHPNCMIDAEDYPTLRLEIVTGPLQEYIYDYDLAYSSNLTSAAVDAYIAGLPVVVMLNAKELNFSPLREQLNVRFVSTPDELAEALQVVDREMKMNSDRGEFFFLDPELPRWRKLLGEQVEQ